MPDGFHAGLLKTHAISVAGREQGPRRLAGAVLIQQAIHRAQLEYLLGFAFRLL